jgi:hypothetical protein
MWHYLRLGLVGWLACAGAALAQGPDPVLLTPPPQPLQVPPAAVVPEQGTVEFGPGPRQEISVEREEEQNLQKLQQDLQGQTRDLARLQNEQAKAPNAPGAEPLQKQVELLQKQIEVLQKMIQLLREQMSKSQAQTAALEARSRRAAQRDLELAGAVDDLREGTDSDRRAGPQLPWTLKQFFDPFDNNETPLSIYGALAFGYHHIQGPPKQFYFGEFTPDFFLKLNDWIFLEAEVAVGSDGTVKAGSFAQADFFVCDSLTISAGRMVAPIGWYNLRSNNPWVTKLPTDAPGSAPLLWQQVLPLFSLLGVQAAGSFYLGCSPVKLEYNAYVSNGLNLKPAKAGQPNANELANLENMESTFTSITNDKTLGGRLGLWWPEVGLAGGISGMYNGDYVAGGFEDSISLWALDLNYVKGNWEVRAEYGMTYQQAGSFAHPNIHRQGVSAEVAYRPRDCPNKYLQNIELIYRYGYTNFRGINPTALDLTTFATPIDVPVQRHQNEFGIDYWFAPRMVLKVAYQINEEPRFHLHDNQFITELTWGW